MPTQVQCENGKILVEQIEHLIHPGEIVHVDGVDYVVQADPPVNMLHDQGPLGKKWVRVVKAKRVLESPRGRGEAVEG